MSKYPAAFVKGDREFYCLPEFVKECAIRQESIYYSSLPALGASARLYTVLDSSPGSDPGQLPHPGTGAVLSGNYRAFKSLHRASPAPACEASAGCLKASPRGKPSRESF